MRPASLLPSILLVTLGITVTTQLWAFPEFARQTKRACATCHAIPAGGPDLTAAGAAFKANRKPPAAGTARAAEYVGIDRCMMCHPAQYKAWAATPHAKAWEGLQNADPDENADLIKALKVEVKGPLATTDACITCHVVGFHLPGGYPQADSARAAGVVNVACEACHGPGSLHVAAPMAAKKKFINGLVSAKLCTQCHTALMTPKFDFAGMSTKVHPTGE